jgi:hypothetical protein
MKFREPESGYEKTQYNLKGDIGSANQTLLSSGGSGGGGGGLFGALGSIFANRQQRKIAEANRKWQAEQNTLAYERSLPWSSYGPAGDVEFDPETKEIMSTLSPEYQDLMNQWLGTAGMSTAELQGMMGDPYAMEQQQFQRFEDLNRSAYARSRAQGQESALARGMQGTESYYDRRAIEDSINQSRLGGQLAAMGTGMNYRQMLGQEALGFGGGAMNIAGMLTTQGDLGRLIGQGAHTGKNMAGVSLAGTNLADTQSGFWSGMQDQAALYNEEGQLMREEQKGWGTGLLDYGRENLPKFFSMLA